MWKRPFNQCIYRVSKCHCAPTVDVQHIHRVPVHYYKLHFSHLLEVTTNVGNGPNVLVAVIANRRLLQY
jgi:hypothetical protein